jgi:hypothetical protein
MQVRPRLTGHGTGRTGFVELGSCTRKRSGQRAVFVHEFVHGTRRDGICPCFVRGPGRQLATKVSATRHISAAAWPAEAAKCCEVGEGGSRNRARQLAIVIASLASFGFG